MKKYFVLLVCVSLCLSLGVSAFADNERSGSVLYTDAVPSTTAANGYSAPVPTTKSSGAFGGILDGLLDRIGGVEGISEIASSVLNNNNSDGDGVIGGLIGGIIDDDDDVSTTDDGFIYGNYTLPTFTSPSAGLTGASGQEIGSGNRKDTIISGTFAPVSEVGSVIDSFDNHSVFEEPTDIIDSDSVGDNVKWVQWYLAKLGYELSEDGITGEFDDKTDAAVKKFQQEYDINGNGTVDAATRVKMKEVYQQKLDEESTQATTEPEKTTAETTTEPQDEKDSGGVYRTLFFVMAVLIILCAAGVIVYILLKGKKVSETEESAKGDEDDGLKRMFESDSDKKDK